MYWCADLLKTKGVTRWGWGAESGRICVPVQHYFIPASNEKNRYACMDIKASESWLTNAAGVKCHSVLWTHCALQRCKLDTPLLAAESLIYRYSGNAVPGLCQGMRKGMRKGMDMEAERAECNKKLEECIQYFRQRPVYHKLFVKVRDKYQSLGHFGGTVRLTGLTQEECRLLGGFFQKDFWGKDTVSISAAAMEKALGESRFSGLSWEMILQGYFQEELVGKKQRRLREDAQRERFFGRVLEAAPAGPGRTWLEETLRTKGVGYQLLRKQYREQPDQLEETLRLLLRAIPRLPVLSAGEDQVSCELLAVFAAETTGDPHFFDAGTLGEQLLTAFLKQSVSGSFDRDDFLTEETPGTSDAEGQEGTSGAERQEGTSGAEGQEGTSGMERQEGTSGAEEQEGTSGMEKQEGTSGAEEQEGTSGAERQEGTSGAEEQEGTSGMEKQEGTSGAERQEGLFQAEWKAGLFYEAGLLRDELSNNTLVYGITATEKDGGLHEGIAGFLKRREPLQLTLMTMRKLARVCPQKGKSVYIVENPAVFAKLMKAWPETAVVCGNGQIRLATLVLLDLFDKETTFLYAGDYDPEGLQIAQRLKERYGERLQLWKYRREFYEKYLSDVEIPVKSLKKLEHIHLQELEDVRQAMLRQKKAAYQEAMLEEYLRD